jgi:quercetin dioxygenase-like cupin family protein
VRRLRKVIHTSYAGARRGTWGRGDSGFTLDWVYFLDDDLCQIVFALPPDGRFTQLDDRFDVYERDTVWHVLSGRFIAANPVTGEVHRLSSGDSLAFRGDVWHHGFNGGSEPVHVIEFTAPPPTRHERLLERRALPGTARYDLAAGENRGTGEPTARAIRAAERPAGPSAVNGGLTLAEILDTANLSVGEFELCPGERTDLIERQDPCTLYVLCGSLAIELPSDEAWLEAGSRDGIQLARHVPHRLLNLGPETARGLLQIVHP